MQYYLYSDLPIKNIPSNRFTIHPLEYFSTQTESFPEPGEEFYPVLPENLLLSFCKNAKKIPAIIVQCADYSHKTRLPHLLSEQQALRLAQRYHARLFHDAVSNACYFCYEEHRIQHMVWLEDGFHLHRKIQHLQQHGIKELAFFVNQNNIQTLLTLMPLLQ